MERTRGAIEIALPFRTTFDPAEPINVAAVGGVAPIAKSSPVMVVPIKLCRQSKLPQVTEANRLARFVLGLRQRRQEQGSENRDDRDYDQQFHQRKTSPCLRCVDILQMTERLANHCRFKGARKTCVQ